MPGKPKGLPKTGGRKKGSENKITREAREIFKDIMDANIENINTALKELYDEDKTKFLFVINKYFPYYMPKKENIDITSQGDKISPINITVSKPTTASKIKKLLGEND